MNAFGHEAYLHAKCNSVYTHNADKSIVADTFMLNLIENPLIWPSQLQVVQVVLQQIEVILLYK